jgi:hypothetical protein
MGLMSPVTGLDKALILLGREKFYRWLSLMLFDFKSPGYKERVLTEQALSRAAFLERLAGQGTVPAQADWLFILGLFSNLDLLMAQSMADLLLQAKLPAPVHDALLGEAGPSGMRCNWRSPRKANRRSNCNATPPCADCTPCRYRNAPCSPWPGRTRSPRWMVPETGRLVL